ncbi:formate dehydrogenase [Neobacillus vireti]|nr:formate dehydrogenase [Neobacillus vireti]
MTNSFTDMKNANVILIGGNNTAECHPLAMRWVLEAQKRGAKLIVVDPRFNRTAKVADIYAPVRPGTDIGYLGAIVKYIFDNKFYDEEYIKAHTNALYKVNPTFAFNDGLFSGYNPQGGPYKKDSWTYQLGLDGLPLKADALTDPDCVLMKLKEQFKDYTFEKAYEITGMPVDKVKLVAETFVKNRPGTILYALGMTQKSVGVQGIRMYAIIQLLLGNMGMAGGGINANRGEPNVQGSTDMAALAHILPGYMPMPSDALPTLNDYVKAVGTAKAKKTIALLKAWYGDKATPENEFGYHHIPKRSAKESAAKYVPIFEKLNQKAFEMGFIFAQNPAVSTPNLDMVWRGLSNLDLLVVAEIFETETASFWQHPDVNPKDIQTEVILLPAAMAFEKAGTMTNSARWVQGKPAAVPAPGEAIPDGDMIYEIMNRVKELYANSSDPKDKAILDLTWHYEAPGHEGIDMEMVLKEMNGYDLATGKLLDTGSQIAKAEPGTVSSGLGGLYTGVITEEGNHSLRHDNSDPSSLGIHPKWTFAWPNNTRVLWNRGSVDKNGQPRDKDRALVWWNGTSWVGNDILDVAAKDKGPDTPEGSKVFSTGEGKGALFRAVYKQPQKDAPELTLNPGYDPNIFKVAPVITEPGIADGPMPAHYEPIESPVQNPMFKQQSNPMMRPLELQEIQKSGDAKDFPYVLTTYMVTEQFLSGGVTRNTPQLNELMPSNFAEISTTLAKKLGVKSGDPVTISTARGKVTIDAMVTERIQTLKVDGKDIEVIGVPWGWGYKGLVHGESINKVTNSAADPNTGTPEYKACSCNLTKGGN